MVTFELGAEIFDEAVSKFGKVCYKDNSTDPTYRIQYDDGGFGYARGYDLVLKDHYKTILAEKLKEEVKQLTPEQYVDKINQTVEDTLNQRGSNYGEFDNLAMIVQSLKRLMKGTPNWHKLDDDMKESLEMVAHKIARILNGNPSHYDSWHDIGGYTTLIANRLDKK